MALFLLSDCFIFHLLLLMAQHLLLLDGPQQSVLSTFHVRPPWLSFCSHSCVFWWLDSQFVFCFFLTTFYYTHFQSWTTLSDSINSVLVSIPHWWADNLVKFNISRTQFMHISLSSTPSDIDLTFESNDIQPNFENSSSIKLVLEKLERTYNKNC